MIRIINLLQGNYHLPDTPNEVEMVVGRNIFQEEAREPLEFYPQN